LRKDEKWHQRMIDQHGAEIVGQEFDADPFAGREGQLIDARSVKAAIDIHKRLNIPMTGKTRAGMDVATRGRDLSALAIRTGIVLRHCSAWREDEVSGSVKRVHKLMRKFDATHYYFDGVGVGGSVDDINKLLQPDGVFIRAEMYQGSEAPLNLKRNFPGTTVSNETLFPMQAGRKHQAWWYLRYLFDNTWRLSQGDTSVDTDEIISIDSETVEDVNGLIAELSQPTYTTNNSGKIIVDKFGDTGTRSPNRADSLLMAFAMEPFHMNTGALLRAVMAAPPSRDSFTAQLGHLRF
jgi:phage terminase large subunit